MQHPPEAGLAYVMLVTVIVYIIKWLAFPVVLYHLAPAIDRQHRYIDFMVAWNWSQVIWIAALLPVDLLSFSGALPEALSGILWLVVLSLLLAYGWYIAVVALQVSGLVATGLVALDFFLGFLIDSTTRGMIY